MTVLQIQHTYHSLLYSNQRVIVCLLQNVTALQAYFRTVFLAAADLDGQSTFGMKENEEKKEIPLQIKEAASVFK